MKYDNIAVNSLRGLALDMITQSKSGHPGIVLSAAPLMYTLFTRHLVADPADPNWMNRDRFVLSAGHASALLYANLHLAGYSIPMEQLMQFRKLGSLTPGHPEFGHTPGIDATSGPLGQGIAQAVGLAMAQAHLAAIYPEGSRVFNHYTYVICGDGCLEEGISQEAISMAGIQKLNKLILLYDRNDCTLDGPLANSSIEDVKLRFEAAKWNVLLVEEGNDVDKIDEAITLAKLAKDKPTLIICHTVIGYGSPLAGLAASHGKAFSSEETMKTKESLGTVFPPFNVPFEAYTAYRETFVSRGKKIHEIYEKDMKEYQSQYPEDYAKILSFNENNVAPLLFKEAPSYDEGYKEATRNVSQSYLNLVSQEVPILFGGSADVASSVKTQVKGFTDFTPENRAGQNINFGIREFEMASIMNGILLHGGLRPYVGSFLVFADYMKPAIRMAAMEKLPAIYLFSHDSIAVGEDGPTHQPIEQLTMLRTIPDVTVYRPADAIETAASYRYAFESIDRPTAIILSRQGLKNNPGSSFQGALKGGYVVSKEHDHVDFALLGTGSEVNALIEVQKLLLSDGIDTRVVSLPALDVFDRQSLAYQSDVLSVPYEKRIFVEMGKSDMLYKYAAHVIGIDRFGESGPAEDVIDKFGFTPEKICATIKQFIK